MSEEAVSEEIARQYLRDVEPKWKAFWFHMHLVAGNLKEFADGLDQISDEVFAYHASGQKNDLAAWVQEVIGDSVLARQLMSVRSRAEAARAVHARVAELEESIAAVYQEKGKTF